MIKGLFTRCGVFPRLLLAGLLAGLLAAPWADGARCAHAGQAAKASAVKDAREKPGRKARRSKDVAGNKGKALRPGEKPPQGKAAAAPPAKLTAEDLQSPYSAMGGAQNATRWQFDPAPKQRPFAAPQEDSAVNLHVGRDRKIDPLTGETIKPPTDVAGAKQSAKELDLKGAVDKLGGKAEVQVDILKF
jgi:hypothetical protein